MCHQIIQSRSRVNHITIEMVAAGFVNGIIRSTHLQTNISFFLTVIFIGVLGHEAAQATLISHTFLSSLSAFRLLNQWRYRILNHMNNLLYDLFEFKAQTLIVV